VRGVLAENSLSRDAHSCCGASRSARCAPRRRDPRLSADLKAPITRARDARCATSRGARQSTGLNFNLRPRRAAGEPHHHLRAQLDIETAALRAVHNQPQRKVLSDNTVRSIHTPAKQRDYQDLVTRPSISRTADVEDPSRA